MSPEDTTRPVSLSRQAMALLITAAIVVGAGACASPAPVSTVSTVSTLAAPEAAPMGAMVCTTDGLSMRSTTALLLRLPVLHGGPCGRCSTPRDVGVYWKTRRTLTAQATACAFQYVLLGDGPSESCLREIGFSTPCATCWRDNIACTALQCRDICLRSRLLGAKNGTIDPGTGAVALDGCLACDELRCGAAFAACAGANRRRSGIVSDIPRPPGQVWQR